MMFPGFVPPFAELLIWFLVYNVQTVHAYSIFHQTSSKAASSTTTKPQHFDNHVDTGSDMLSDSTAPAVYSRRGWMSTTVSAIFTASFANTPVAMAAAALDTNNNVVDPLTSVYFGVGCFWHIQHEFVQAERDLLGRDDHGLTSRAGYAGGRTTDDQGRVCYHNLEGIADYGKLGHGEVVGMEIPESKIEDFAQVYFSLFNPRTKDRVDPGDRGSEYRSLIGLPGGLNHPKYAEVQAAARDAGFTLRAGQGNDPDTFGKALVYVYDTNDYPFHQAELYHQYHNDFQSPPYGRTYNSLAALALEEGRIEPTACPFRFL